MLVLDVIRGLYVRYGYVFFDGRHACDLNLFGVRCRGEANRFDDLLGCVYAKTPGGALTVEMWPGTTDPGSAYLAEPMNSMGTAIVVPGQYRGLWKLGLHRGKPAFVQVGPVKVYRDRNRDEALDFDPDTVMEGVFGINGHRAGRNSQYVDRWSAGCQVWKRSKDHDRALWLGRQQVALHPTWTTFTYTLFDLATDPEAEALFTV